MKLRVALDIGGVISKYPEIMCQLAQALTTGGAEVLVITDMQDRPSIDAALEANGFGFIPAANIHCADYARHGEGCKAELLRELGVHIMLDDFIGYVAEPGCPIRCLVMPDASRPYYADTWQMPSGEPEFGRRVYQRNRP